MYHVSMLFAEYHSLRLAWIFFTHALFPRLLPLSVAQSNIGQDLSMTNSMPSSDPTVENTTDIDAIEKTPTLLSTNLSSSVFPSSEPSTHPTSTPSLSTLPTGLLSDFPSSSPTSLPGCPDKLRNYWVSMEDDLSTMKHELSSIKAIWLLIAVGFFVYCWSTQVLPDGSASPYQKLVEILNLG